MEKKKRAERTTKLRKVVVYIVGQNVQENRDQRSTPQVVTSLGQRSYMAVLVDVPCHSHGNNWDSVFEFASFLVTSGFQCVAPQIPYLFCIGANPRPCKNFSNKETENGK
ncbi:hypothetical protein RRG08_023653 [Elysia crispata]|uniref:Uncharacterized protein n=1 Tax=Elysia crispata TaxID=231223 RepID=A0AAE0XSJ2_9GAST|nr:hypothetical protein RRG08_023653 [Elysia crispata]